MVIPRDQKDRVCLSFLSLFHENGVPVSETITRGRLDIFRAIVFREHRRYQFTTSTQYGKSFAVALACIIVTCIQNRKITVVAPTGDKAKIIMRYYIQHIGDHELFYSQLERNTKLERLRQEESKERITLRDGGGMYTISANATNSQKSIEAAMGEGSEITILDEGGLIPDETEATIFRMIAGKGPNATYVKIGNPFYDNHFKTSSVSPLYHNIVIDYEQALAEGVYTHEFIEEARTKPLFDILYGCKFPEFDKLDEAGWHRLLRKGDLARAFIKSLDQVEPKGPPRLGIDPAAGGDHTAFVLRYDNVAMILEKNRDPDVLSQVPRIIDYAEQYGVASEDIYIGAVGVGEGPYKRLHELGWMVNGVREGASPTGEFSEKRGNLKAEAYLDGVGPWVKQEGNYLVESNDWLDLLEVRYKPNSSSKVYIEKKEDYKKRLRRSPDVPDAFMMTFCTGMVMTSEDVFFA